MLNCSRLLGLETGALSRLHNGKPVSPVIVWNLAKECNLSCAHCYAENMRSKHGHVLSTSECKSFIDTIAGFGTPCLIFSGGEPLLRGDIYELLRYAGDKGLYTALSTNGTLITKKTAWMIKEAGVKYVGISVDGLEKTHDAFRGKKGSFKMAMRGIYNTRKENIKTGVRFTLTRYNYTDLIELVETCAQRKVDRFCLYHLVYSVGSSMGPEDDVRLSVMRDIMERFFEKIKNLYSRGRRIEFLTVNNHADGVLLYHNLKSADPSRSEELKDLVLSSSGCSAARGVAGVDAFGDVHPCQFWEHVSLGNILERPFGEIWNDDNNEFLKLLRNDETLVKGACAACAYKAGCRGCRLRAERFYGDAWHEDPACYLNDYEILYK